jgi:large conductance mechanosensitive channel
VIGGVNTSDLKLTLKPGVDAVLDESGAVVTEAVAAVTWNYGAFVQNVIDFLIIAVCLFCIIKFIAKLSTLKKKEEAVEEAPAPAPEPEPTKEEILLAEIRDLLKAQK